MQHPTPPPRPFSDAERASFLKKLDFRLRVYIRSKERQRKRYGQEIADLYRPGHEPSDVVEAREREDERELAEMEATDSEDQRLLARRAAVTRGAAAQAHDPPPPPPRSADDRTPEPLPRKKRRRDAYTDARVDNARSAKRLKAPPAASTTTTATRTSRVEPSRSLALAESARGAGQSLRYGSSLMCRMVLDATRLRASFVARGGTRRDSAARVARLRYAYAYGSAAAVRAVLLAVD
ncbi:hypothetical protein N658DRAFT_562486 [Parathielavia hyrcaniae]|uniref:Uncharacterized protein n=1 Tax=Parathielavia hyrcaniae TaxID=113614 RepID=A0AAN6SWX1_9PEZI|nr:hypothetical protein N658DRAFT_562486 [Parathielavia hyrcaniae]